MKTAYLNCGHCGNISDMERIGSVNDLETIKSYDGSHADYEEGEIYNILRCPACKKINIAVYTWNTYFDPDDFAGYDGVLYPSNEKIPLGLPSNIEREYLAADKIKTISPGAYALLLGRILELICLDRSAKGHTLAEWLNDLKERNEIPDKLVKVASGLRSFRNVGAHAGVGEIGENEIPLVKALCDAILEFIYTAPHLADLAEKKLQTIKEGVKKKKTL
jgi:hypothetical protein